MVPIEAAPGPKSVRPFGGEVAPGPRSERPSGGEPGNERSQSRKDRKAAKVRLLLPMVLSLDSSAKLYNYDNNSDL